METGIPWAQWDKDVQIFKKIEKESPSDVLVAWRRHFLLLFMQDLSKNLLATPFDLLIDKIIQAIQLGMGFKCVRVYLMAKDKEELILTKTSPGHEPRIEIKEKIRLPYREGADDAVDTLFSSDPLILEHVTKAKLTLKRRFNLKGPYFAVPLLVERKPSGLICANELSSSQPHDSAVLEAEFSFRMEAFSRAIMAAVENRQIFEQRNQKEKQLETIETLSMIILKAETEKNQMYNALLEQSVMLVNGDSGHLKLFNEKTGDLERVADYGDDIAPPSISHKPMSIGFSNHVYKTKESLIINNISTHPFMKKHTDFYRDMGYLEYLEKLTRRKSAIIVPLTTLEGKVIGVLDIHGKKKDQFNESDKENLKTLVNSVIQAVDKTRQMEQLQELIRVRESYLEMLKQALAKADNLNLVLEIIRDGCLQLIDVGNLEKVCLSIKDPQIDELITPSVKCGKIEETKCIKCLKRKIIIQNALKTKKPQQGPINIARPILFENEIIGVLYLQGRRKISLTNQEETLLGIIISTAAIMIKTSRNYEISLKQIDALYEIIQNINKMQNFEEWFYPVMEKVMEIMGRKNRNFHLVLVEGENNDKRLIIRATSDLYIEGQKSISLRDDLLGKELPWDTSLSGLVVRTGKTKIILDIEMNNRLPEGHPDKLPCHLEPCLPTKEEVAIPLKIKVGLPGEEVIGVLIIDSLKVNDFQDFDVKFHEGIADYLAIAIHNQRLYTERARFQEELYNLDRSLALQAFMKSFFHDITPPLQEIRSQINITKDQGEPGWKENLEKLETLTDRVIFRYNDFGGEFAKPFAESKRIEINELIRGSLESVDRTRGLGGIQLSGNYNDSKGTIECYRVFIEMAFRAIINNAVKYSRKIDPKQRYLKIDVKPSNADGTIVISFESSSILRIPDDKDIIFKPFSRGTEEEQGQGLGLSIASECIHLHSGDIQAENIEGKDAVVFHITIPRDLKIKKEKNYE